MTNNYNCYLNFVELMETRPHQSCFTRANCREVIQKLIDKKNRSMLAKLFPYMGIQSIFDGVLHITTFKCMVLAVGGSMMA